MDDQQRRDYDPHIPELHRLLAIRFDKGELRTLTFHLQVDYDDLRGEGKSNKARELIAYLVRHGRLSDLLRVGRDFRPDIPWPEPPPSRPGPHPQRRRAARSRSTLSTARTN